MEEKRGLRWLIQQEGKYFEWKDVPEDVRAVARQYGYEEGMKLVLTLYKPACRCRQVGDDGVNLNVGSLRGFRSFVKACEDITSSTSDHLMSDAVMLALFTHNAGSASARHNGNTGQQPTFNSRAIDWLFAEQLENRGDDWACVYEKVMIARYETNAIRFNEADYRHIVQSMSGRSKDEAGRREFLARWLESHGRHDEAVEILRPVETDTASDPVQQSRALELLKKLTPGIVTLLLFAFQFAPRLAVAFQ